MELTTWGRQCTSQERELALIRAGLANPAYRFDSSVKKLRFRHPPQEKGWGESKPHLRGGISSSGFLCLKRISQNRNVTPGANSDLQPLFKHRWEILTTSHDTRATYSHPNPLLKKGLTRSPWSRRHESANLTYDSFSAYGFRAVFISTRSGVPVRSKAFRKRPSR